MRLHSDDTSFPVITKVGAIVLRPTASGFELLVIQPKPKPKTPDDLPPIGLVRGTRAMRLADGAVVDANHDGRTAPPADAVLEPLTETLAREIEEEAGIAGAMLANARVVEMGARLFGSLKKTPYPIHWYVVVLDAASVAALPLTGMQDSLYSTWLTLAAFEGYVAEGKASPGYLPVVKEALGLVA